MVGKFKKNILIDARLLIFDLEKVVLKDRASNRI